MKTRIIWNFLIFSGHAHEIATFDGDINIEPIFKQYCTTEPASLPTNEHIEEHVIESTIEVESSVEYGPINEVCLREPEPFQFSDIFNWTGKVDKRKPTIISTVTMPETIAEEKPAPSKQFNYASFDCGAVIRASNKEAEHPTYILLNAKDSYMLDKCSSKKYIEIELCQDIMIHQLTLANFEYFSSIFQDFVVFGSSDYPPSWVELGKFKGILQILTKRLILEIDNHLRSKTQPSGPNS
jgi:hypothetical protein